MPATETGTSEVNSDYTAAWTVQTRLGLVVHDAVVVTDRGQGFITTETDPFAVVNRRGQKLGKLIVNRNHTVSRNRIQKDILMNPPLWRLPVIPYSSRQPLSRY